MRGMPHKRWSGQNWSKGHYCKWANS